MATVVACSCGKKLKLPEGFAGKAVRCPGCQSVIRVDPPAAPPPAEKPTLTTAPRPPAPPAPVKSKLIKDPPNVWLYVDDPKLIARADGDGDGRKTTLKTFGPADDPLNDLDLKDADDLRAYLGKQEYVAWVGRPSTKFADRSAWKGYLGGGIFAAAGLGAIVLGALLPVPTIAIRIVLWLFGLVFAGVGVGLLVMMARGMKLTSAGNLQGVYLVTNRRAIVWVSKAVVRSFTGPMVQNMKAEAEDDDEDFGNLKFTHGMDGNPAGPGFCSVEKLSEVEELVRAYLVDRVLEKAGSVDGPRLAPADEPNPFKKDDKPAKGGKKGLELWQSAALAMEAEKPLTPEMVAAAEDHTETVLEAAKLSRAEAAKVRDERQPGETIVWTGRPDAAGSRTMGWLIGGAMMVAALIGGAIVTTLAFTLPTAGGAAVGFGVFGGLAGLLFTAGLAFPFYHAWRSGRSFYVLTSRRALVWAADFVGTPKLEEFGPRDLTNLHVVRSDVVFRTETTVYKKNKGGDTSMTQRFGFLAVADAPEVERLVRETLVEPYLEKAYE